MSATLDHLNKHREVLDTTSSGEAIINTRPRIVCADGFSLSAQAGTYLYSSPRTDSDCYASVEVGYPSERCEALMPFIQEAADDPELTVYPYVPVEVVDYIIAEHGGIKEA